MRVPRGLILLPALALTAACATVPGNDDVAVQDPLQKINRPIWKVNQAVDRVAIRPVTVGYRHVVPKGVRHAVTDFFSNVSEPWSAINSLLQGQPKRAGRALKRFVINTTVGIAGFSDPATRMGIRPAPEDFGQTLAVWGVNSGPYLVLPLLGPSTFRDAAGTAIAFYADPYRLCLRYCGLPHHVPLALTVAYTIDVRSQLIDSGADAFLRTSLDPYAVARSAYLQNRRAAILNRDDAALPAPGTAPAAAAGGDDAALQAALKDANGGEAPAAPALPGAGQPVTPAPAAAPESSADDAALNDALKDANGDAGASEPAAPAEPTPAEPAPAAADASAPPSL